MTMVLTLLLALAGSAWAQSAPPKRVALIIANSAYEGQRPLANPISDAAMVEAALKRVGFEVLRRQDLDRAAFDQALIDFNRRADGADAALVYYAGHGVQVAAKNYMLPIDFSLQDIRTEENMDTFAFSHGDILRSLGGAQAKFAVFDACRDSPFDVGEWINSRGAAGGTRSAGSVRGLAQIEQSNVLVMFSAGAGRKAADGEPGRGSPFAREFSRLITTPGRDVRLIAGDIRTAVVQATGGERNRNAQQPFISGDLGADLVLVAATPQPAPGASPTLAPPRRDIEAEIFEAADTCDKVQAYLNTYPRGRFIRQASAFLAAPQCRPAPRPPVAASPSQQKSATPTPVFQPRTRPMTREEQIQAQYDWERDVRFSNSSRRIRQFLEQYPLGSHVEPATRRIAELEAQGR